MTPEIMVSLHQQADSWSQSTSLQSSMNQANFQPLRTSVVRLTLPGTSPHLSHKTSTRPVGGGRAAGSPAGARLHGAGMCAARGA